MNRETDGSAGSTSLDAFHRGRFWLVQPAGAGHRAGIDAMMLAAAVPGGFAGSVADFGAGAGAAGLAVIARCPDALAVLVERSPEMAGFARQSLALPQNDGLAGRAKMIEADVTLTGRARIDAGLADNSFDFVIMNPPFNSGADRATPDALKRQAHVMDEGMWDKWLRTASAVLDPRGGLALIARPEALDAIMPALNGRFGGVEMIALHSRDQKPAIRVVLRAVRGSRKRLAILPPLILHGANGNGFTQRTDDICNGLVSLFGD